MAQIDTPAARGIIEHVIATLKAHMQHYPPLHYQIGKLNEALSVLTRHNTKKVVRRGVLIDDGHKSKLIALLKSGADKHMTNAEMAIEIFGQPVNLGWVSEQSNEERNGTRGR